MVAPFQSIVVAPLAAEGLMKFAKAGGSSGGRPGLVTVPLALPAASVPEGPSIVHRAEYARGMGTAVDTDPTSSEKLPSTVMSATGRSKVTMTSVGVAAETAVVGTGPEPELPGFV